MPCPNPGNCAPCDQCAETPTPVQPRCDIDLIDGTYVWATVTVENGCITAVSSGAAPLYQPESCCATPGSGGEGGDGLDGDEGPPGQNATIQIGQVFGLPYGSVPQVVNVGSPTNAVLDFYIPRGEPGEDATAGGGLTIDVADIEFQDGILQSVPVTWPPVLLVNIAPIVSTQVDLVAVKDPLTGIVTLALDTTVLDATIADFEARIAALEAA